MEGIVIVRYSESKQPSGNFMKYCTGLLDTTDMTDFKKTHLIQGKRNQYDDTEVTHRKMEGSVEPFISDLPYDWSYDNEFLDYNDYYKFKSRYQMGTNESFAEEWQWYGPKSGRDGKLQHWHRREWKFDESHNHILERSEVDMTDPNKGMRSTWTIVATKQPSGNWSTSFQKFNVTFELHDPIPYYWEQYMDTIRPWTAQDQEALSELIRNTINEETTLATNNYANLSEVIDLIDDFRKGKILELVSDFKETFDIVKRAKSLKGKDLKRAGKELRKRAADGWLQYRYAYNTTKSDVEQYARQVLNDNLRELTPDRVLRGQISISSGVMRVKMRLHRDLSPNLNYVLIGLDKYGLFPGLYNLWDMIPFSFIVDWFTPLGDMFQDIDQRVYFNYYKVDELLVSKKQELTRNEPWGPTTYTWYERILLDAMPQWEIYEEDPKNGKVWSKRAADAASIVTNVM